MIRMHTTGALALAGFAASVLSTAADAATVVAEGWASLEGRTAEQARQAAEQRAYEDLRDRVEGVFFFWSPATGAKLMGQGELKVNAPPYGAKLTYAGASSFGMYHVKMEAELPADSPAAAAKGKAMSATGSAPAGRDPAGAFGFARRAALVEAIGSAITFYFAVQRASPTVTSGRAFPVGAYNIAMGRDALLVNVDVKVWVGGAGRSSLAGAPRSKRNVFIEVANRTSGDSFRQTTGTRMRYRGGDLRAKYGAGVMGKQGLNTKFRVGKLSGRVHTSQERTVSSGGGAMTLMVQDGTTGYLDVGAWVPMSVSYRTGGIDPRTGRPVQLYGTLPIMTHTGARLAVRATILDGGRIRITAIPEYASLTRNRAGRRVAGAAVTVTARDGQPMPIAGLSWRGAATSSGMRGAQSRTLSLILTPHIR